MGWCQLGYDFLLCFCWHSLDVRCCPCLFLFRFCECLRCLLSSDFILCCFLSRYSGMLSIFGLCNNENILSTPSDPAKKVLKFCKSWHFKFQHFLLKIIYSVRLSTLFLVISCLVLYKNRTQFTRVPTFPDWQNSLTFPWLFQYFSPIFQYFFSVLFSLLKTWSILANNTQFI